MRRIEYAGSVHDEQEVQAVLEVLRGGATAMRIGKHVRRMEELVAATFGKARGVMCNSGSSGLYLAVELLGLPPGAEVITSALTFSTDIAPLVRAGLVPVYVDVVPDTFQIDTDRIEAAIGPATRAILAPNLIGNCPDWDAIRTIADRHDLLVIEDSCDALGATLRGTPTGTRSDFSVTSFALSHIITAMGTGGMICMDQPELIDRCLLLRRWGRRSEVALFGSTRGDRRFFSELDGLVYDDLFIFDEVGWNFEPSEASAAFGAVQMAKLPENLARRRANGTALTAIFAAHPDAFTPPRFTPEVESAWHMFPILVHPARVDRARLQRHLESHGVDTRMVWTGNVSRQPAFRNVPHRIAPGGLAGADLVMETGLVLPCNHAMDLNDCDYIGEVLADFLQA